MKRFLCIAAVAACCAAVSCTKTDVNAGTSASAGEQKLTIGLSSGEDALKVKSGRPLLSEAPGQDIHYITLYFVNASTSNVDVVKEVLPAEWANATEYENGRKLEVTLKKSNGEELSAGQKYTVYALGYSTEKSASPYTFPTIEKGNSWDEENFILSLKSSEDVEEVFAGQADVWARTDAAGHGYLTSEEAGEPSDDAVVVLNRQVAGVTGYFTNIPAEVNGIAPATLRLIAARKYTRLNFISLYGSGEETVSGTAKYVVNGSVQDNAAAAVPYLDGNKGYTVYEMALSDWFQFGSGKTYSTFADCDLNGDGVVGWVDALCHVYRKGLAAEPADPDMPDGAGDFTLDDWATDIAGGEKTDALDGFWKNPVDTKENPQQLVAGSVFAGKFIIPFELVEGVSTLELQLVSAEGTVLKTWNVRIPASDVHASDIETPTGVISTPAETQKAYNVYRNHMYSLGSKGLNLDPDDSGEEPEEPGDDDDYPTPKPDPDPDDDDEGDNPQDLNTNDLLIHVNDRWEIIHDMEID